MECQYWCAQVSWEWPGMSHVELSNFLLQNKQVIYVIHKTYPPALFVSFQK